MALVPFTYRIERFAPGPANSRVAAINPVNAVKSHELGTYQAAVTASRPKNEALFNPNDEITLHQPPIDPLMIKKDWPHLGIHNSLGALHRILVAYDASPQCRQAINVAGFLARAYQSELHILQVLNPEDGPTNDDTYAQALQQKIIDQLEPNNTAVHYLSKKPSIHIKRSTQIVSCIHQSLSSHPYDLIITAKHRKNFIEQFLHASITKQLAKQVKIPLLAVGHNGLKKINKILVPFDGSKLGYPAIHQGILLAEDFRAELNVLHVIPPNESAETREAFSQMMQQINWGITKHSEQAGDVIKVLKQVCETEQIDLVIMTTNVNKTDTSTSLDFLDQNDGATLILHETI